MARDTPAARARARRDPAIFTPPPRVKGDRKSALFGLTLNIRGRQYPIHAQVEGDTPWSLGMDQAGTVTLPVRDPEDALVQKFADERQMQQDGIRVSINGVIYMVVGVEHDGEGLYTLTVEDEVAWRLKQFNRFRAASRARTTRFGFIQSLVDEASRPPMTKMRSFIPEVDDKQHIRKK